MTDEKQNNNFTALQVISHITLPPKIYSTYISLFPSWQDKTCKSNSCRRFTASSCVFRHPVSILLATGAFTLRTLSRLYSMWGFCHTKADLVGNYFREGFCWWRLCLRTGEAVVCFSIQIAQRHEKSIKIAELAAPILQVKQTNLQD